MTCSIMGVCPVLCSTMSARVSRKALCLVMRWWPKPHVGMWSGWVATGAARLLALVVLGQVVSLSWNGLLSRRRVATWSWRLLSIGMSRAGAWSHAPALVPDVEWSCVRPRGVECRLVGCHALWSDHVGEGFLAVAWYFVGGFGLEYGLPECGVNVGDQVCEVGLGPGASVEE